MTLWKRPGPGSERSPVEAPHEVERWRDRQDSRHRGKVRAGINQRINAGNNQISDQSWCDAVAPPAGRCWAGLAAAVVNIKSTEHLQLVKLNNQVTGLVKLNHQESQFRRTRIKIHSVSGVAGDGGLPVNQSINRHVVESM